MAVPITQPIMTIPITQAIVEFLKAQDIRYIFGKVGEDILPLLDYIASQDSIKFISTYREETAVFMADGYARVTGTPAIVLVSGGTGASQTIAAMAQAFYDGSPVILLAGELPMAHINKEESITRGFKQEALFEKLIRSSHRVSDPHRTVESLEQAYRSAASGKKGPVYWGIPRDLLVLETPEKVRHHSQFMSSGVGSGDPELVRRASGLLIESQSPVILLGGGVIWSRAAAEAMELAEFLFAPIVTSRGKSGIVPDDYPLSIGGLGSKANKVALQTVAEADVLIAFGCTFNDRTTFGFSREIFSPNVKIIQVDIDPRQIGRNYAIELGIVGDARMVLKDILSFLSQVGAEKWPSRVIHRIQRVWERKEAWSSEWTRLTRSGDIPIRRLRLLKDIVDEVGREGIIFGEIKWKYCLNTSYFPLIEADDFALPGAHLGFAIGAKMAHPARPVAAVLGDGQFITALTELAAAVEHRIPILAVVARNGCYGQAKATQTQFYDGRYIGVDHPFPNYADVALSLGAYAERVETPTDIRPALRRALESQRPAVIEVVVSPSVGDLKPIFD
ncbi:MAG: thiamine pyrophosphate-binding protein [Deltaproteobacteria bacterium]|nr:thiamine pyrophosphate-binding protein [Deltaproteobacteria bacterium]